MRIVGVRCARLEVSRLVCLVVELDETGDGRGGELFWKVGVRGKREMSTDVPFFCWVAVRVVCGIITQ